MTQADWLSLSSFKAGRQTRLRGGWVSGWTKQLRQSQINSSEGHLPKKDVRSRTEMSPVATLNCVREGKVKSRRFVLR